MTHRDIEFSDYAARQRPRLFRTAMVLVGDPHRAEDIVQDALTKLYRHWNRVSRLDQVDAYTRRMVVNAPGVLRPGALIRPTDRPNLPFKR